MTKTVKFVELTLICCNEHSLLCLLKMYEKVRKIWIRGCVEAGILSVPSTPELRIKQFSNTKNAALEVSLILMGFASISHGSMI